MPNMSKDTKTAKDKSCEQQTSTTNQSVNDKTLVDPHGSFKYKNESDKNKC